MQNKFLTEAELKQIERAQLAFRAVNHTLRQQILGLIQTKGPQTVTEIYVTLYLEQSVTSQHLAILRKAGVVDTERDGKKVIYSINKDRINELIEEATVINLKSRMDVSKKANRFTSSHK